MIYMGSKELREDLLLAIMEDEHEACFDRSYCSDKQWERRNGDKNRMTGFLEAMEEFNSRSVEEIIDFFDDRYNYVFEKHGITI
jgi:hypothetical protein